MDAQELDINNDLYDSRPTQRCPQWYRKCYWMSVLSRYFPVSWQHSIGCHRLLKDFQKCY